MKDFDKAQIEQLQNIVETLRKAREERSLQLEEVAVKTYIPLRLLQALEQGQLARLPEPVFVQGFIRRYADTVGLDGTALAKTFVIESSPSPDKISGEEKSELPSTPLPQVQLSENHSSRSIPVWVPIAVGSVVLVLVGFGAFSILNQWKSNSTGKGPTTSTNQPVVSPTPTNATSQNPSSTQVSPSPQSSGNMEQPKPKPTLPSLSDAPVQATVELTGDSWMQIIVDGKPEFEGILKKGYKKTWTAQKTLTVQSGNAGAVMISYNQGESKPLGANGEVKDISFPPEKPEPSTSNQNNSGQPTPGSRN